MKTRDKIIVVFSFLIISILGLTLSLGNRSSKENVAERKSKYLNVSSSYGDVDTSSYFTSDSENIQIDGNSIVYSINNSSLTNNEITAHFDTVIENVQTDVISAGTLLYYINSSSLFFYDDAFGAYEKVSNTKVSFKENGEEFGYIKSGSDMPYCDFFTDDGVDISRCDGNYDYYWYYDAYGVLIANGKDINVSGSSYTSNLSLVFALDSNSSYITEPDGYSFSNSIEIDGDIYDYDPFESRLIESVQQVDLSNVELENENVYSSWQSSWGIERTNFDYYVVYPISGYVSNNSNYYLEFTLDDNYDVVAFSGDGTNYITGDIVDFRDSYACDVETSGYSDVGCYVVIGYNVGDTDLDVDVGITLTAGQVEKNFNWHHTLNPKGSSTEPEYPDGVSKGFVQRSNTLNAGDGAINRLNSGGEVNFGWLIEADGTANINNGYKAFNLWKLTNNGTTNYTVSLSSAGEELDSSYNSVVNPYELNGSDYSIVSFYPQDDVEYNYVPNGTTYNLNVVTDYSTYTSKDVYVSINGAALEKIGSYVKTATGINYVADDSRTTSADNVSESNPVILPENVTKLEVRYTGKRAAVYLGFNVNTKIVGTTAVKNKISSLDEVVLKNKASLAVNGESQTERLGTYLGELEVRSYSSAAATKEGRIDNNKTDIISYEDNYYEQMNYNDSNKDEVLSIVEEQKNGTVYELLPAGAEIYENVTVKTIGNNGSCQVTTNTQDHYAGTNRTLLTINIGTCPTNKYDTGTAVQSGYVINYKIKYTSVANQSYGTVLDKDSMYVASKPLGDGYSSASGDPSVQLSDSSVKTLFDSIVTGNNNLLFTTVQVEVESLSISEGTYSKKVSVNNGSYSQTASVIESKEYTYKLQYAFTSEMEVIKNVIFIDKLENEAGNNGSFKGYLESVDVSYLTSLGASPIVYYSVFDVDTNTFNSAQWTTTMPDDVTTIKAIAVDCGTTEFSTGRAPEILVKMKAPNNYAANIAAYNKSNILYKRAGESNQLKLTTDTTVVQLQQANVSISGTSNYGTGSSSNPATIEGNIVYTFTVKNNDNSNGFDNVVVEVELAEGLDASGIDQNHKLYLTIDHLDPSETKELSVETSFVGNVDNNKTYQTKYRISSLGGSNYSGEVGSIYNRVSLPNIEAHKYVKTVDSNTFTDEADSLIKKDEVFTYRVNVKNTSNVNATGVEVVDTIPEGLTVTNAGSGTVNGNKITWTVNVNGGNNVNLDYQVKLNEGATLGSSYRSAAHVKLVNPYASSQFLFDEDTNIVSVIYQIASSVKVTNNLSGALANTNKEFEYEATFTGTGDNAGRYDVLDSNGNTLNSLNIDANGTGSYTFKLKGSKTITFKNLTGGIHYTIKQKKYNGYDTHVSDTEVVDDTYVTVTGETSDEGTKAFTYTNSYSASGEASINAKVTYDKDMTDEMFKVSVDGVQKNVVNGQMETVKYQYSNEVGQHTYIIKQVNTNYPKISYDSNEYKAVVNITDNGEGKLNTEVKYYDNSNKVVEEVVFNNTYLPNGLKISNVNNSEYVDANKIFNYSITLTDGEGTYEVKDNKGNNLDDIVFNEGVANYSIELLSNESILIVDLPDGIQYEVKQNLVEYYETSVSEEFNKEENLIVVTGVTEEGSKEIKFTNTYETKASFEPVIKVTLEGKEIEDAEFKFKLVDVSSGATNGYTSNALNDEEGNVLFNVINFTRPGVYKYEIVQLDNGSNHIYFDYSKVILTLELTDNGDGTMEVLSSYQYANEQESIHNKYSVEPIVKEEEETHKNPNTSDRVRNISILLLVVIVLIAIERWVRHRRFQMNV